MPTGSRVIRNALFMYGKIAINAICLLLSTRYVLLALGVEDFGLYNLIGSIVLLFSFVNSSMTEATQRFLSFAHGKEDNTNVRQVFNSSILIHCSIAVAISAIFICLLPILYSDFVSIPQSRESACTWVYLLSIFCMVLSICNVPYNACIIAHEQMFYYAVIGSLSGILKLLFALTLFHTSGDKLIWYAVFTALISLIEFTACRFYCKRNYDECSIDINLIDKKIIKEMFSFAGWQFAYSASSIISIQGVSLILNSFYGAIMNAAQGVAKQVCGQLMTFSSTLSVALNPALVKKAGANQLDSMLTAALSGCKLTYLLLVVFALPVLFELEYLLTLWLDEVPDYSYSFCLFEVLQQIIASLTLPLVTILGGMGKIKGMQLFSSLTYICRIPIIYFAFMLGGSPIYAYYITTSCVICLVAGRIFFAHKDCGLSISLYVRQVAFPCISISVIVGIFLSLYTSLIPSSLYRLIGSCFISFISFSVFSYYLVLNKIEKSLILGILNRFKLKNLKS